MAVEIYEFIYELPSVCMGNSYINSYVIVDSHTQMTLVQLYIAHRHSGHFVPPGGARGKAT